MRLLLAAALLLAAPARGSAEEDFKAAADRRKVDRVMSLRAEVDKTCGEIEPLLAELSALQKRYPGDCRLTLRPERERLGSAVGERIDRLGEAMGELKTASHAEDIVAALEAHSGRSRPRGASEVYLQRSIQSTVERFAKVKGAALAALGEDEAAYRSARKDCEARAQRRRWAWSLLLVLAGAAFLAWCFFGRGAPLALLCLLWPAVGGAQDPLGETKVRRVAASCEEGDALIAQLEPALERLKTQQAGYASTCRLERLAIGRDKALGEIDVIARKLNAVKNDLHALRRNDMFVSLLTQNKPALVGAAIKGGPKKRGGGPAPEPGAAHEYFTRSYDAGMLRIKEAQYRTLRVTEEDELAFKAAKEACLDKRVRNARLAALAAFACLLAGAAWLWLRGRSGI